MAGDDRYGDVSLMAAGEPHHADHELPLPASPPTELINTEEYLHAFVTYDRLAAAALASAQGANVFVRHDRVAASAPAGPIVAPPTEPTNLAGFVPMIGRLAAYLRSTLAVPAGPHGAPLTVDLSRLVNMWPAGERGGDVDVVGADVAYGHGGFGAVPASGDAMAALPETTVGEGEATEEECAVCLERYEAGDTLRTMPCSHGFHGGCILGWLAVSRLCPLCRFALPAEEESDVEEGGSDDDGEVPDDDDDVAC